MRTLALSLAALTGCLLFSFAWQAMPPSEVDRVSGPLEKLPLSFIENRGQTDPQVAYYVQGRGYTQYFTGTGHALRLTRPQAGGTASHVIAVDLLGATSRGVQSLEPAAGVVSYFKGPREQWHAAVPTHARIGYVEPWPGVALAYDGDDGRLESIYTIAPHADPAQIRLRYRGHEGLRIDSSGNLVYGTSVGDVVETAPVAYQDIGGERVAVESRYALLDADTVGFEVAAYDPGHALVIDPSLIYSGFVGGGGVDRVEDIAVDSSGNAYLTGYTASAESAGFPATAGPDLTYNSAEDAFVMKLNAAGTAVIYAGYIGGSGADAGNAIAVDGAGNAYVAGRTQSTEATFPETGGPDLTHNGSADAFVAKVSADGTTLDYAGYIGGVYADVATGIAVDGSGNAYVSGFTNSDQATFPETGGPDLSFNGNFDAFVAKVNANGATLAWAGYIGGDGADGAYAIAVDGSGNAYVTGVTNSTQATFPETGGPDLTHNGLVDTFVAKVASTGASLTYAGYIGGSGDDYGNGIAVDASGNAYVAGMTTSDETTFPVVGGPDASFNGGSGGADAYVAKVNATGSALSYAGFIGGTGFDAANDIAVDGDGNAYVVGDTDSSQFPASEPYATYGGGDDAFVAMLTTNGIALAYASYIGGSALDSGQAVAVDGARKVYVAGHTVSTAGQNFPLLAGPQLANSGGGGDGFVTALTASDIVPDAFAIPDKGGVERNAMVTSEMVFTTGTNAYAEITIANGEYSVGCTGTFTSAPGRVGNAFCVRHTSSGSFMTATHTVVTIGGVSDTFTSTTAAQDVTPDAFTFVDQTDVAPATTVTSAPVTISGINDAAAISVSGGEYSVGCNGAFTGTGGTIANGQSVCVRHTSAGPGGSANTVLTVGGVSDTFTSTTVPQDTTPDAFSFGHPGGVALSVTVTSTTVTVSGINSAAPISVVGGEYSIGCGTTFTATAGTIDNGQTVCVRHTSAATEMTDVQTTLDIGGVAGVFTSTTGSAASGGGGGGAFGGWALVVMALGLLRRRRFHQGAPSPRQGRMS